MDSIEASARPRARGRADRTVGPYRLLRELGRGGMSSVWLAERSDGLLKRHVALKLPHAGPATRAFADRLLRERDILAALTHPNIARLYDAGIAEDGQPYLALAHVDGRPLLAHCNDCELGVDARIALFLQVLAAVQHAHSHLVIHRDIKPSNVLVDDHGQVHLLDFGIAKLALEGTADATLDAGAPMTLDYASPEQLAGIAIGTASDVYSLGVLLCELLCGARPYELRRDAGPALSRALAQVDMPRPSTLARAAGRTALARRLAGDLDTIVLKALRMEPHERYRTADAFAEDLRRHLDGAPVLARPDAVGYRIGKFVRRHRLGVAAATAFVFVLGLGLAGTAWQARKAHAEAQRAQVVQDFLVGLFDRAAPGQPGGRAVTVRQLLDRAQRDVQAKLAAQPGLSATLDGVLVELYSRLGEEAKALPLAQSRCELALRSAGPGSLDYGDALYALAGVQQGLRDIDTADATYDKAHAVLARYADERRGELLLIEANRAFNQTELGRAADGIAAFDALLPRLVAHFGARHWLVIQHRAHMAAAQASAGQADRALSTFRDLEPLLDEADDAHLLEAANVRFLQGHAQLMTWQVDFAQRSLRRALDVVDPMTGPFSSDAVLIERDLVLAQFYGGDYRSAAQTAQANVQRAVGTFGEDDFETRLCESSALGALWMLGRADEAHALAQRAVRGTQALAGMTPARLAGLQRRHAMTLAFAGRATQSVDALAQLAVEEERSGAGAGFGHAMTLLYLAGAQGAAGRDEASATTAQHAERLFESLAAPDREWLAPRSTLTRALALARTGRPDEAQALMPVALARLRSVSRPDHPVFLWAELVRADILRAQGLREEARQLDEQVRTRLRDCCAAVPPPRLFVVL